MKYYYHKTQYLKLYAVSKKSWCKHVYWLGKIHTNKYRYALELNPRHIPITKKEFDFMLKNPRLF